MARRGRRSGEDDPDGVARPSAISDAELIPSQDRPTRVEVLASHGSERSLRRWWQRQSGRRRRAIVGGAAILVVGTFLAGLLTRPQPQPPAPTAWPALRATVAYVGSLPVEDPTGRRADFLISVRNWDTAPMTVVQILFDYRGLTLRTEPGLPLTVQPGQIVHIQLITTATDCSHIPEDDELPFIDVTFRNLRAMGQESEILGDRYTVDLHRAMTAACRRGQSLKFPSADNNPIT